jgi:hypothetical protein
MALSEASEAHENIPVTYPSLAEPLATGARHSQQQQQQQPPSTAAQRLRARTATAQPPANGRNGIWSVGEYQISIVEVTGHFCARHAGTATDAHDGAAQPGDDDAGPQQGQQQWQQGPQRQRPGIVSQYPILSLALCLRIKHVPAVPPSQRAHAAAVGVDGRAAKRAQAMAMAAALEDLLL